MTDIKRKVLFAICFIAICTAAVGQNENSKVTDFIEAVLKGYSTQTGGYLFHYSYSNESTPTEILDSITVETVIKGVKYYCKAANTEIFCSDSGTTVLYHDEKIMYLSKSKPVKTNNPIQLLDSLMKMKAAEVNIQESGNEKSLVIAFPHLSTYKEIIINFDTETNSISSMQYLVKTAELTETDDGIANNDYDEYAYVRIDVERLNTFDSNVLNFSPLDFYKKEGQKVVASGKYKDYHIYLGSINF